MLTRQQLGLPTHPPNLTATSGNPHERINQLEQQLQMIAGEHRRLLEALQGMWDTLNRDGALDIVQARITASHGIIFPATQNASTDANTLDDYQESKTWTPIDASGAGLVFTTANGRYTKVGGLIFAWGIVTYPVTANAAAALLGGLPFALANVNAYAGAGTIGVTTETTLARAQPIVNTTTINLLNSVGNSLTNATLSGDTTTFSAIYMMV